MPSDESKQSNSKLDTVIARARDAREQREKTYRERAMKLFPSVCARCGREISGKKLRELTVHHKDHNHDYNPPDGSNWELLCIYCHDNEHSRYLEQAAHGGSPDTGGQPEATSGFRPFADLEKLLRKKE